MSISLADINLSGVADRTWCRAIQSVCQTAWNW